MSPLLYRFSISVYTLQIFLRFSSTALEKNTEFIRKYFYYYRTQAYLHKIMVKTFCSYSQPNSAHTNTSQELHKDWI